MARCGAAAAQPDPEAVRGLRASGGYAWGPFLAAVGHPGGRTSRRVSLAPPHPVRGSAGSAATRSCPRRGRNPRNPARFLFSPAKSGQIRTSWPWRRLGRPVPGPSRSGGRPHVASHRPFGPPEGTWDDGSPGRPRSRVAGQGGTWAKIPPPAPGAPRAPPAVATAGVTRWPPGSCAFAQKRDWPSCIRELGVALDQPCGAGPSPFNETTARRACGRYSRHRLTSNLN